jgi:DNA-binding transcriptional LysR family regulator
MNKEQFKDITFQQMEAVISLVEERSFSRAAKRMLLSQPALTNNIKNVEVSLGVLMINRSNAGISLTPEGKILYDYAQRMLKLREEARTKIIKFHENTGGNIYIGASTITANYIFPRALSMFSKTNHDIRTYIKTAESEEAMNMVLDNEVEIGFIGKKPFNKKLTAEPLWKDRLILVVPRNHPWCIKKSITLEELSQEPFILPGKGSATRELFESYLKESKSINLSKLNICGELGGSAAIKEAVIAGWGVSVTSIHAVERELSQRLLFEVPIQICSMKRNFYLIYKRQFYFQPYHKTFINFIKCYTPAMEI